MTATEEPQATTTSQIRVQRELERLRQESETFNQVKRQDERYFWIRVAWSVAGLILVLGVFGVCVGLIASNASDTVRATALGALIGDVLAAGVGIQKVVLFEGSAARLAPVTPRGADAIPEIDTPTE